MVNKDTKNWDYLLNNNDSFYDRVFDICNLLQIEEKQLKEYWENSEYGLIYILKFAVENKRLP